MEIRGEMATGTESAAAIGWLTSKLAPAIGGLIGGLGLAAFWTPEKLREKGKVAAVFIAGGISVGAAFIFTGLAASLMGIPAQDLDKVVALSAVIGVFSVAGLNWVANWIERRENMDIGQIASEVRREVNEAKQAAPRRRAPAKKTPARVKK
jgi:hypothetical protein